VRRLFVVLVLLAAACGAERPTLEASSGIPREAVLGSEVAPTDDGPVLPVVSSESLTVRLAVPDTWSLDPAGAGPSSITERVLADLLYEGLTLLDVTGNPAAGLAVRWEVSADRLTWSFVLPAGLVDGQGFGVSAAAVAGSLTRVAERGSSDQAATALTAVSGWQAVMDGEVTSVAGVVAVDDTTLRIVLDRPFELLPLVLASPPFGITTTHPDGSAGTTGSYRTTDDPNLLAAVSASSPVAFVRLVPERGDVESLIAEGAVDWAVIPPSSALDGLPGEVIREPLDMRVGFAVRLADRAQRLGLVSLIDPIAVADEVPGLSALVSLPVDGPMSVPPSVVIDAPEGRLAEISLATARLIESTGVDVDLRVSSPAEFARRVSAGEATVFPVVIAGGTGVGGSTLRFFSPGAVDDVSWAAVADRDSLAGQAMAEIDPASRLRILDALEQRLVDSAMIKIVGRFEVSVSIGARLEGLRQRPDGTLDLSSAMLSPNGS